MSITSETQRKYDPNKGGFSYYTLFHADKGERPTWAQDGDMLEEFGEGGKAYVCSRDAKGRIKWTEKADWDRQTGGGSSGGSGGGLPADFPTKGIANANKFLGFDANGDYTAKDAPSGGGAEKFIVTLTENGGTWTADESVSIADIVAAKMAGKDVEVLYPYAEGFNVTLRSVLIQAVDVGGGTTVNVSVFSGEGYIGEGNPQNISVIGTDVDGDVWSVTINHFDKIPNYSSSQNGEVLGVSSGSLAWVDNYAPLIVTLTEDESVSGQFNGDKTYREVYTAYNAGRNVIVKYTADDIDTTVTVVFANYDSQNAKPYDINCVDLTFDKGAENDYVTFTMS